MGTGRYYPMSMGFGDSADVCGVRGDSGSSISEAGVVVSQVITP